MTRGRRGSVLALLVGVTLAASGPVCAGVLDYLYIEPDVGGSAGGHVALRLDDSVYHFQNTDGGMLRLARESWDHFRWQYSVRQNRPIHVARIRASDDTRARLRTAFDRRWLAAERYFADRVALEDDAGLLASLRDPRADASEATGLRLRGAGYFFGGPDDPSAPPSEALGHLGDVVAGRFGPAFVAARIAALEAELAHLDPATHATAARLVQADELPRGRRGLAAQRTEVALELLALRALAARRPLRADAVRTDAQTWGLADEERAALAAYGRSLEEDLARLLTSPRDDRGHPLLVGMARLVAIEASVAYGRLVVLDTFPSDTPVVSGTLVRRRGPLAAELAVRAGDRLAVARARFVAAPSPGERELQALEEAANREDEIRRALRDGSDLRLRGAALVPERLPAGILPLPTPVTDAAAVARAAEEVAREVRTYDSRLRDVYGYHLTRHNCVSEIFATIDATFDAVESRARLGGRIDPGAGLDYVPAISFERARATYDIAEEGIVPSYRQAYVAEIAARDDSALARLRETSTLTSSIYRGSDRDSRFLFFTDGALATRPLFGACNIAAGISETTVGLLAAPFDRGHTLWSGIKGVVFSLPELAFLNLRKGTFEVPPDETPRTHLVLSDRPAPG